MYQYTDKITFMIDIDKVILTQHDSSLIEMIVLDRREVSMIGWLVDFWVINSICGIYLLSAYLKGINPSDSFQLIRLNINLVDDGMYRPELVLAY